MRWLARHVPAREPLLRNKLGRTLFAGLTVARPWRLDPDDTIEQTEMFGQSPGFLPTLPHTFEAQVCGLESIECPVLVLWGSRDVLLLPRQGRRFERLIPDCELRYLKGLGHVPMSDDPELIAELVATTTRARRAAAPA
jgi:pimeloyl-ACP methyl ester carboxylesterase